MTDKGKLSEVQIKGEYIAEENENIHKHSKDYLNSLTQTIFTQQHIYQCLDCFVYGTKNIDDEYVIIVLEIMDSKLKKFYGGDYMIQQWIKKKKIFQMVHTGKPNQFFLNAQRYIYSLSGNSDECEWLYVINFYQEVCQKIKHPFFSLENPQRTLYYSQLSKVIHDSSIYVDPKQVLITLGDKIIYGQLKIENIINMQSPKRRTADAIQEIDEEGNEVKDIGLEVHQTDVQYFDIMENCEDPDKPTDIIKIADINNEGFSRKEVHICVERKELISIYQLISHKSGNQIIFELERYFEFFKSRISIDPNERIQRITMENIADTENVITIHRGSGEVKVISENILIMMDEYEASKKLEEEPEDEPPPPLPPRNAFQRFLAFIFRENEQQVQNVANNQQEKKGVQMKAKLGLSLTTDLGFNKIDTYFNRRSLLYFKMSNGGDMRKVKLEDLKNFDPLSRATRQQVKYQEALLQDVALHISFFKDFLIANTTLIICHGKILSILDFQTNTWDHLLPQEQQVNVDQSSNSQSYFGQPAGEIEQLVLNHIFSNSIYDCLIKYQGLFIRRLKYYNDLNKTYFEKGKILDNFNVIQLIKNSGSKNYRLYGEIAEKAFFLIEDKQTGIQQIWLSQNGSKINKLIEQIRDKWKIMEIPNAPSDMLPIYSLLTRTLTIYTIRNMNKLYRPNELHAFKTYEIKNFLSFDPNVQTQYFFFDNKLYYNHLGNITIIDLAAKNPLKSIEEISFDQQIQQIYMTDPQSVYYKDKNNVFRLANIGIQKQFNMHSLPTQIFHCAGAFLNKIDYGPTLGRLGVFKSPFDIVIIPCLDKCRIDMIASQEFDLNFVCYKEDQNRLYGIKKPNSLVTWNLDNGVILNSVQLKGMDFESYKKHSEWNGCTLLKQKKDVKIADEKRGTLKGNDEASPKENINDSEQSHILQDSSMTKDQEEMLMNPNKHAFILVEIKSDQEVVEHCSFVYEYKLGLNIYVSMPYVLVMDENSTKMYTMEGHGKKKTLKILKTFFEPQMKVGKPIYFSPSFIHRMFIDANTKKVMINHSLTNKNIIAFDIKKQLMFQKKKTHPMIYFHDDEQIIIVTHTGIEKIFKIVKIPAGWFSKARVELQEQSNCYYSEESFLRRFMMDPLNFNNQIGVQNEATFGGFKQGRINLMKFKADILQRHLKLNIYQPSQLDEQQTHISRFFSDRNINQYSHYIIDNYRRDMSFNYLSWRVIEEIGRKKISVRELSDDYIEELLFTILPGNKTLFHYLQTNQEALNLFLEYIKPDPDEIIKKSITISDIPFIPNVKGKTPLHKSLKKNNASMTDQLIITLKDACFDHHCKYIMTIYHELLENVPASMTKYLDNRLISTPWVADYTRGRVQPLDDSNFVMSTFTLWDLNLKEKIDKELLNASDVNEVPLNVFIFDIPDTHKYLKENADNILEALATTEQLEIFESTTVRAIIEMKWPLVRKGIIKRIFIPYVIFVSCFLLYSTYVFEAIIRQDKLDAAEAARLEALNNQTKLSEPNGNLAESLFEYYPQFQPFAFVEEETHDKKDIEQIMGEQDEDVPEWQKSEIYKLYVQYQKQIFKAFIMLLAVYFVLLEFRQFVVVGPSSYLTSPWNYIDIIPLALIITSGVFEYIFLMEPSFERPLNAISCFFMWIKFLYLLRIFRPTSKFISMIEAVIFDMKDFMVVFFITICAFSQAMYILSNANADYTKTEEDYTEENPNPQFIFSLLDSIFFAYRMSLGDFDTGNLGIKFQWMSMIFFVLATMFLTIVMLNLLIAVISSTYERVRDTSISQMYKTMADLTAENEYLVPDSHLAEHDDKGDYLYLAILDEDNDDQKGAEASLNEIKKTILGKSRQIEEFMVDSQRKLINTLTSSTEKQIGLLNETITKGENRVKAIFKRIEGGGETPGELKPRGSQVSGGSRKGSQSDIFDTHRSPTSRFFK